MELETAATAAAPSCCLDPRSDLVRPINWRFGGLPRTRTNQLNSGLRIGQIAQSFSTQAESTALYSYLANPSAGNLTAINSFIDAVYGNLFNRAPDPLGKAYWAGQLQSGQVSVGAAILDFINGALVNTTSNDARTIMNKVSAGNYYSSQTYFNQVQATLASEKDALAGVSFAGGVAAAQARIDAFVQAATHSSLVPVWVIGSTDDNLV